MLGALRTQLGRELGLLDESRFRFLWVTDFPMFERVEEEDRWGAVHHPFTRPAPDWEERFDQEPGEALAHAYDLVCHGTELGGGSFRIHEPDIQEIVKAFGWKTTIPVSDKPQLLSVSPASSMASAAA